HQHIARSAVLDSARRDCPRGKDQPRRPRRNGRPRAPARRISVFGVAPFHPRPGSFESRSAHLTGAYWPNSGTMLKGLFVCVAGLVRFGFAAGAGASESPATGDSVAGVISNDDSPFCAFAAKATASSKAALATASSFAARLTASTARLASASAAFAAATA